MILDMLPMVDNQVEPRNEIDVHTQTLLDQIRNANRTEVRRYRGIDLEVFPRVFFPLPYSSGIDGITGSDIRNYNGKRILDIGSGTGIRAIVAGLSGAREVVAVDIVDEAVDNTVANINRYNLQERVKAVKSNLFEKVEGKFDVVIGYLPLVDHPVQETWEFAVFDPAYSIHSRFFAEVDNYLEQNGIVKMVHSSKGDVRRFEELVEKHGLEIKTKRSSQRFNFDWHFYDLNCANGFGGLV